MGDVFYKDVATIWNKTTTGGWEEETWFPTVVENVRIQDSRGLNIQKSGNEQSDKVRLHISDDLSKPDKPYAKPEEWVPGETYTLNGESYFSIGDMSEMEPDKRFFERSDVFRISNVDRFDLIPHFEVWGK